MAKSILNVIAGVEVECFDETDDKPARVVIRNSKGKREVLVIASVQDGLVTFKQALPIREDASCCGKGPYDG